MIYDINLFEASILIVKGIVVGIIDNVLYI